MYKIMHISELVGLTVSYTEHLIEVDGDTLIFETTCGRRFEYEHDCCKQTSFEETTIAPDDNLN